MLKTCNDAVLAIRAADDGDAEAERIWMEDDGYSDAAREVARMFFEYGPLPDEDLLDLGYTL